MTLTGVQVEFIRTRNPAATLSKSMEVVAAGLTYNGFEKRKSNSWSRSSSHMDAGLFFLTAAVRGPGGLRFHPPSSHFFLPSSPALRFSVPWSYGAAWVPG